MAANGTEIGTRVQAQLAWKGRGDALLVVVDRLVALLGFVIPAAKGAMCGTTKFQESRSLTGPTLDRHGEDPMCS